jgi:pimeloyl-ACP methyl ester carboxylesterase
LSGAEVRLGAGTRDAVRLPDGRRLEYLDAGPRDGIPVLYLHGTPAAALEWRLFGTEADLDRAGIRLVAPNRPGVGGSTYHPKRKILGWPADAATLLDRLDIGRVALLGYSGGSPYALACGGRMPDRITAVMLVSAVAAFDAPGVADGIDPASRAFMELSRRRPAVSRLVSTVMGLTARISPRLLAAQASRALPPPDAAALKLDDVDRLFAEMLKESTRGLGRSARLDTALMIGPWGFDPGEVTLPVHLWHATEDRNAPPAMGAYLANRLPNAELTVLDGDGHISAAAAHGPAILADLARRARQPTDQP